MLDKDIDDFLKELAVSKIWSDDFASAIETENDLEILKAAANLKDKNGNRLYDNFQLFQILGDDKNMKIMLAEQFLQNNPEFSGNNYTTPDIDYIIKNQLSETDIDFLMRKDDRSNII